MSDETELPEAPPLGVYVHWPFCARICPYCDFNVRRDRGVDVVRWRGALVAELRWWAARTKDRRLASLHFGGGTPSRAPAGLVSAVIDEAEKLWGFAPDAEIGLEANPADATKELVAAYRNAGVGRLSLGVQSFDDAALNFLGRDHDAATARRAVSAAREVFDNVSIDLIYALPDQTPADWRRALKEALGFGAPHLSAYQLTIERGTAFSRAVARGRFAPPSGDVAAALYEIVQEQTDRAGLPAYEVSNHARPGCRSRHNMLYWTGGDYIGVGPGAHGRVTESGVRLATETERAPEAWLEKVETTGSGAILVEALDGRAMLVERLAMGLRLVDGVALSPADLAVMSEKIEELARDGLLWRHGGRVGATAAGRRVLDSLTAALLAGVY